MRINKYISEAGKASRRGADKLVEEGRVTINGKRVVIGSQAEPGDEVRVDGNHIFVNATTCISHLTSQSV